MFFEFQIRFSIVPDIKPPDGRSGITPTGLGSPHGDLLPPPAPQRSLPWLRPAGRRAQGPGAQEGSQGRIPHQSRSHLSVGSPSFSLRPVRHPSESGGGGDPSQQLAGWLASWLAGWLRASLSVVQIYFPGFFLGPRCRSEFAGPSQGLQSRGLH